MAAYDKTKVPFKWTATAGSILEKHQRLCSHIYKQFSSQSLD